LDERERKGKRKRREEKTSKVLEYNLENERESGRNMTTPIIILHGLFGSSKNWASISKLLAQRVKLQVPTCNAMR